MMLSLKLKGRILAKDTERNATFQQKFHDLCDEYGVYIAAALDDNGDPHVCVFEGVRSELTGEQTCTPNSEIEPL